MPELPSLEIYKDYFDSHFLHQVIEKAEIKNPEILINVTPNELRETLVEQEFISSRRYGKYLFSRLDNDYFLIIHFGMTGYIKHIQNNTPLYSNDAPKSNNSPNNSHIRFWVHFKNGHELIFDDIRKFGKVGLTRSPDNFVHEKNLGPDALEIDFKNFKELFKKRKGNIKSLIMNQNFIAGIGNLYADEILYQSRIHPLTTADKLDKRNLKKLYQEMKKVLKTAIEHHDVPHKMPSSFLLAHRYPGGECPNGEPIETMKIGGRTTYFCPIHQKLILS